MFGFSTIKLVIIGLVAAAIFAVGGTAGYKVAYPRGQAEGEKLKDAEYKAALKQQKDDATFLYNQALKRNADLEKANATLTEKMNGIFKADSDAIDDLSIKLAKLGQLRDPFAKPGRGCGGAGPVPGAANGSPSDKGLPTQTDGLLSEQFTGFLRSKFAEADRDAEVAKICHLTYGQ